MANARPRTIGIARAVYEKIPQLEQPFTLDTLAFQTGYRLSEVNGPVQRMVRKGALVRMNGRSGHKRSSAYCLVLREVANA
jgi:hypothetical protein